MTVCSITSKVALVLLGVIFWGASAALFFIGAWVLQTYKHYDEITTSNLTLIPAVIVIAVGVFLFFLGLCGCIGAVKEHRCILAVFFSLVLIVLAAEVAAGILGYVYREDIKSTVHNGIASAIGQYSDNDTAANNQVNYMQNKLQCCGVDNATDWSTTHYFMEHNDTVPESCCMTGMNCTTLTLTDQNINKQGCYETLEDMFNNNLSYIAGTAIAFAVLQILGLICTCILMCRSKEVPYHSIQGGGFGGGLKV